MYISYGVDHNLSIVSQIIWRSGSFQDSTVRSNEYILFNTFNHGIKLLAKESFRRYMWVGKAAKKAGQPVCLNCESNYMEMGNLIFFFDDCFHYMNIIDFDYSKHHYHKMGILFHLTRISIIALCFQALVASCLQWGFLELHENGVLLRPVGYGARR